MSNSKLIKFFLIIITLIFPHKILAVNASILISEIMYDYPASDNKREWLEVKNISDQDILINSNWRVNDGSNHLLILFQGQDILPKNSYIIIAEDPPTFLLDHPNFNGIIYKSAISLTNQAENLKISPDSGQTWITEASYNKEMGANGDGKTLEWDDFWQLWRPSFIIAGTPGRINSSLTDLPRNTQNIFINEILANPSVNQDNEFIEIYNHSDEEVDLSAWLLDDGPNSGSSPYIIAANTKIGPKNYLFFYNKQTNLNLDNNGDTVRLLFPNQNEAQVIFYPKSDQDLSYQRTAQGNWQFSPSITPGKENIYYPLESANFAQEFVAPAKQENKNNITASALLQKDIAKNTLQKNIINESQETPNQTKEILEEIIQGSQNLPETPSKELTKPAKNLIIGANIFAILLLFLLWKRPTPVI